MEYLFYMNGDNLDVAPELKPTDETEALELSVQKWKSIIYLLERGHQINGDGGPSTCALCKLFFWTGERGEEACCELCPVQRASGRRFCISTPHEEWEKAVDYELDGLFEAREELAFLESLKGE